MRRELDDLLAAFDIEHHTRRVGEPCHHMGWVLVDPGHRGRDRVGTG